MRTVLALLLLLATVTPGATAPPATAAPGLDDRLPSDPRLVTGRLDNGFTYVIRRHPTAEKRIGIWLHVASGSLNETDSTRGIAHYLEHLAFNGSANFPPGALVPLFEQLGLTFGRDQNAFTTFDQTTYQIMVPAGQAATLDKALLFMSDVASRLDLTPQEIDRERQIILEEKRARASGSQRVQDHVIERLAPESTLGRRLPIGTEATIRSMTPADFRDFYRRWYVPANMTLIVAGDSDPAVVAPTIATHFGGASAAPRPARLPVGVQSTTGTRAIVATDPELTRAEVSLVRLTPPRPPSVTVGDSRRDLVESIGTWILGRRLDADIAAGRARFEDASATTYTWNGAARVATLRASGRPDVWRDMLADLGLATQRARLHGFTEREMEDARSAMLSRARDAVARDATAPIRSLLSGINDAIGRGVPIMSAAQRLALLEQLLPGITAREVSTTLETVFDPTGVVVVAKLPSSATVPDESALASAGRAALDVTPPAAAEAPRPSALLSPAPKPGHIAEQRVDAASTVTSAWLDNGARVHHRFMTQRKGEVIVSITLAGGEIEEDAATRGLTQAATQAWLRPATSKLTSTDVRDLLIGKRVDVGAEVDEDSVTLTLRTTPGDLESALQLAYLLLTDPVVEPISLARWKEARLQGIEKRRLEPMQAMRYLAAEALAPPAEARMRPLRREDVTRVTRDAAQAWLHGLIARAPIEAAVVGEVDEPTALGLVAGYLGAVPARPRITATTLAPLRQVARPSGPVRVASTIETRTAQAAVLAGFRGADARDRLDTRLLMLASRVLSSRMYRTLREERQLVYSIGASSRPAFAYPGFGLFVAQAPTEPARAEALANEVHAMYAHFAKEGPTAAEVDIARRQLVNLFDDQLQRPDFWAAKLAVSEYRDQPPRDALDAREQYARAEPSAILDAFRRYWNPAATFTVVVTPADVPVPAVR
ncbi:MAG: insulinase family protein [Candidatus Rokubacteria bacterium]|nr:insulinase family protein [Candidatus Rokubacteria bacterium]